MTQEPTEFTYRGKLWHGLLILLVLVILLAFKINAEFGNSLTVLRVIGYLLLLGIIPAWLLGPSALAGIIASRFFSRTFSLQKALVYTSLSMTAASLITAGMTVSLLPFGRPFDHKRIDHKPMIGKYSMASGSIAVVGVQLIVCGALVPYFRRHVRHLHARQQLQEQDSLKTSKQSDS